MTTLHLAPQYDPAATEAEIYRRWMDAGVFTPPPPPPPQASNEAEPYVIVIPPPNVTAVLHMGHGLNNTLQDISIRFERMRGRAAEWLPGTDHAGIATQNIVERLLADEGKTRHDVGRGAFVDRVWQHVNETGNTILEQLKAIGASCDWSRTRFTLDDGYSHAVRKVFVTLHNEDLIYRGHRVIHWCPRCHTSLSDEEAEFHDRDSHLYYIKYPFTDGQGHVAVATTRPETVFADVCLVFHPDDKRYQALKDRTVRIPLNDVVIPIATSNHVEPEFGTGMLKVTPAHDPNDFDIANELEGEFDQPIIIDLNGNMAEVDRVPEGLRTLDRDQARKQTVKALEGAGLLDKVEPYHHRVRQCYRCNTVIEPTLSDQWFVRMKPLAEPALKAYREGKVRFIPERWGGVYENWLTEIRDWNISRQLWWGHRIPAWYCNTCDKITVAEATPSACECGGELRQDEDVLDTWFSSWLWPFATFGWPDQTNDLKRFYPGHTLVTGPDIIFFWVARMIMAGYHFMGERPFATVYLNGMVRDAQKRKMSKSLGNGIDPMDIVHRHGADALRYTMVSGSAMGADVLLDHNDLDASFAVGRNFANKIWNVGRFILTSVPSDNSLSAEDVERGTLTLADRWILSRTQAAVRNVTELLEAFRYGDAANAVYHFVWDELADWYVEQVKPRLSGGEPGGETACAILVNVFETALELLHPFTPFISEELWAHLPGERADLLAGSRWPTPNERWADLESEDRFGRVQALIAAVRSVRAEYRVSPGKSVSVVIDTSDAVSRGAFEAETVAIQRLAKIDAISYSGEDAGVGAHAVLPDGSSLFVPLDHAIDVAKECSRLRDELNRIEGQLHAVVGKLRNEKFVNRAPSEVVDKERQKEQAWREQREALADKLRSLGC